MLFRYSMTSLECMCSWCRWTLSKSAGNHGRKKLLELPNPQTKNFLDEKILWFQQWQNSKDRSFLQFPHKNSIQNVAIFLFPAPRQRENPKAKSKTICKKCSNAGETSQKILFADVFFQIARQDAHNARNCLENYSTPRKQCVSTGRGHFAERWFCRYTRSIRFH